jgi:hypothetical protein
VSTSGIGTHADGVERPWEPGIENVQVDIRSGDCPSPTEMSIEMFPSAGLDSAVTDPHGTFEFVVLSPGSYCLSISKDQTDVSMLTGGLWTEPLTEGNFAYKTITIPAGTPRISEDFGWDQYDHPTLYMEHITHCRGGDSKAFPAEAMIENQFVPLIARSQDASWLKTRVNGVECFFYYLPDGSEDEPTEDEIMDLPIFESPPRPLPSPTPTRKPSKPSSGDQCSVYQNVNTCTAAGCTWNWNTLKCEK